MWGAIAGIAAASIALALLQQTLEKTGAAACLCSYPAGLAFWAPVVALPAPACSAIGERPLAAASACRTEPGPAGGSLPTQFEWPFTQGWLRRNQRSRSSCRSRGPTSKPSQARAAHIAAGQGPCAAAAAAGAHCIALPSRTRMPVPRPAAPCAVQTASGARRCGSQPVRGRLCQRPSASCAASESSSLQQSNRMQQRMPASGVAPGAAAAGAAVRRPACRPGPCPPSAAAAAPRPRNRGSSGSSAAPLCHTCSRQHRRRAVTCGSSSSDGGAAGDAGLPEEDQSIRVKCMLAESSGRLDLSECELAAVPPAAFNLPGARAGRGVLHPPACLAMLASCCAARHAASGMLALAFAMHRGTNRSTNRSATQPPFPAAHPCPRPLACRA